LPDFSISRSGKVWPFTILKCDELAFALLRIENSPSFLLLHYPKILKKNKILTNKSIPKNHPNNPPKKFLQKILPKKSSQKNPPKKSSQKISPKNFCPKNSSKKIIRKNSIKIRKKKPQKIPKISKQFHKKS
jgi:hypothetical protein